MKHNEHIQRVYESVRLDAHERAEMKLAIRSAMTQNQSFPRAVRSPFPLRATAALTVASCVLMATAGVSYASQTALPGESLYVVKRSYEDIHESLALSASAKIKIAASHAVQRLRETAQLRAKGALTSSVESDIASDLKKHLSVVVQQTEGEASDSTVVSENAIAVGKVVGYTNALNQANNYHVQDSDEAHQTVHVADTVQEFVNETESVVSERVNRDVAVDVPTLIISTGNELASSASDPIAKATIETVVTSDTVTEHTQEERGSRVLHAIADMAEGAASAEFGDFDRE